MEELGDLVKVNSNISNPFAKDLTLNEIIKNKSDDILNSELIIRKKIICLHIHD